MKKTIIFFITLILSIGLATAVQRNYYDTFDSCNNWTTTGNCNGALQLNGDEAILNETIFEISNTDSFYVEFNVLNLSTEYEDIMFYLYNSIPDNTARGTDYYVYSGNNIHKIAIEGYNSSVPFWETIECNITPVSGPNKFSIFYSQNEIIYYLNNIEKCRLTFSELYFYDNNVIWFYGETNNPSTLIDDFYIGYDAPEGFPIECTPFWQCSQYSDCIGKPYNHKDCLAVSDANNCGESFSGDLATYEQTCTVPSTNSHITQTATVSKQATAISTNPIEQLILNFRTWIFNLIGLRP